MFPNKISTKECENVFTCGSSEKLFEKNNYIIRDCTICKHRYTIPNLNFDSHININYDDSYFFGGRIGYPNYFEEKDILIECGKRYADIINKIRKPGRMLDVGSASGFILQGFIRKGWQGKGIEPNEKMAIFGKQNLCLDIEKTTLEDYETTEKFDLVSLIQVIGHFYDIDKSIRNISKILAKDGLVLVESWNMKSLTAKLLGSNWHEYSPPTVLHWFSRATLNNLFLQWGFIPIKTGIPIKRISFHHAISLLDEKVNLKWIKLISRRVGNSHIGQLNVIYPPLDIFWTIFKKF